MPHQICKRIDLSNIVVQSHTAIQFTHKELFLDLLHRSNKLSWNSVKHGNVKLIGLTKINLVSNLLIRPVVENWCSGNVHSMRYFKHFIIHGKKCTAVLKSAVSNNLVVVANSNIYHLQYIVEIKCTMNNKIFVAVCLELIAKKVLNQLEVMYNCGQKYCRVLCAAESRLTLSASGEGSANCTLTWNV